MVVNRGDIWLIDLDPAFGSEQKFERPCVIVSPDDLHYLRTVIIAPMTTKSTDAPFRVPVTSGGKDGRILLEQIRVIDKSRLKRRLGAIDPATLEQALAVLRGMFSH